MDFNDEAMKGAVLGLTRCSRLKVIVDMVRSFDLKAAAIGRSIVFHGGPCLGSLPKGV